MTMPGWITSRWAVLPLLIAGTVSVWNGYVALNDGGIVEGHVVDAGGRPVRGATVVLLERHHVMHNERQRTSTDASGRFRFSGNDNHSLQLEAEAAGLGRSERRVVRLWFKAQNVTLAEPLMLKGRLP
ncbi:MAG: carboxypeptidase regulatory-like domain-containing protein [Hyphomicrobiaceae bacterium]|nr:MAG: carboxypeptidase regulatory-like domain-containing protein [Hyphomicrobiaceae bacterium]